MQERRTTIRINHACRAQYCATEDLLPRDGRIANVSERGVNVLLREPHKEGEQVTVSFSLPGADDTVTATGSVRWSAPSRKGRWYPVGLEWLPLEETTRNRLQAFLRTQAQVAPARAAAGTRAAAHERSPYRWIVLVAWLAIVGVASAVAYSWVTRLQEEARQLEAEVAQRNVLIAELTEREQRLAKREKWLQRELNTTKTHLATAAQEVARLDEQAQHLSGEAQRLNQEVELFQQSYVQVQEERARLIQEVMRLEQEKLQLSRRLSSLPELQLAIREAIESRKKARVEARNVRIQRLRSVDLIIRKGDNQGYVIRDGRPTIGLSAGSTLSIRVHEPETNH